MIRALEAPRGVAVERGWVDLTADLLERYHRAVGEETGPRGGPPPLGFALALRGEPFPAVELATGTVSFHAGHVLRPLAPLIIPGRYKLVGCVSDVFAKSGRSGQLTVIARRTTLQDQRGTPVFTIEDQQITRWDNPAAAEGRSALRDDAPATRMVPALPPPARPAARVEPLEPGEQIAVEHRAAPDAQAVRRYAEWLAAAEPLFVDRRAARRLGFADVIVPGPLQSALLEGLLTRALPGWRIEQIACTFRISVVAGDPIMLAAVVTDYDAAAASLHLDLTLENADGERAAIGSATLAQL